LTAYDQQDPFAQLAEELDALYESRDSEPFLAALERLRSLADSGSADAATYLGELLALPGTAYDPAEAYKWYYIGLSQQGYSVEFDDHNHTPPHYCGPVGDFRNESMVSELILTLGFDRIQEIDKEAAAWLDSSGDRN
jgi:hypothetical protein